ncbi:YceI family protein [Taibaiella koreensis]|uniref:YceI family protein n=1 Tax=Taibaiella koreensis TaxID=1268548 RepID=UPI000E59FF19|nr:YceI family protein [Taibaiella koreensis]
MNKAAAIVAMLCLTASLGHAQKWMTRTGKVSFFSSTSVENIEAFNNEAASVIDAKSGDVAFIVPIKSFKFDKALMQEHFNENYMESSKYPKAEYKGKITNAADVNFSKDGTYNVKTTGKLTMHGVTKDVPATGTIVVKSGTATIKSKFMVAPADFGIKIPSVSASKIASKIEITVDSVLKEAK